MKLTEKIMLYVKTLCAVSIFSAIMGLFISSDKYKKAFMSLCSVVIVYTAIMPLFKIKSGDFKLNFSKKEDTSFSVSESQYKIEKSLQQEVVAQELEKYLSGKGYDVSLEVKLDGENEDICLSEIIVFYEDDTVEKDKITALIKDSVSKNVTVAFNKKGEEVTSYG